MKLNTSLRELRARSGIAEDAELHMSYRRPKAEAEITGLEKPINLHLLKLLAVAADATSVRHWREELLNCLDEIADIRLKPDITPAPAAFYFRILFDEPFGGTEVASVTRRLERLERSGYKLRDGIVAETVAAELEKFHRRFAAGCAAADMTESRIEALLAEIDHSEG